VEEKVTIVFTAAGNPKLWTEHLKSHGCIVVHVVSSVKFALKAQACGVDALLLKDLKQEVITGEKKLHDDINPFGQKSHKPPFDCCRWNWLWSSHARRYGIGC